MHSLIEISKAEDIPIEHRGTPVGLFLEYHNLGRPFDTYSNGQLLIGMCMDSRKHLTIPENFAYIIRTGGANLRYSEFRVSYAIALGRLRHIAIVGHNNCGMVHLEERKEQFITGLIECAGWNRADAEKQFDTHAHLHEIGNEIEFAASEAERLRTVYPLVTVVPMHYKVEDNRIYLIDEGK